MHNSSRMDTNDSMLDDDNSRLNEDSLFDSSNQATMVLAC